MTLPDRASAGSPFGDDSFFEGQTFQDLDHEGALVAGKEFFRCTFRGCRLPGSRWDRCSFEKCTFEECDLTHMKPMRSGFHGVVFRSCKLLGAELSNVAENPEVTFEGCMLRYVAFNDLNLRATTFRDCELQEAQFSACSLIDADLLGCDLSGASFSRCELGGADFSSSRGVYLDPRQNSVKGAFVPAETAVMLAHAAGLKVDGYDERPKRKRGQRR